MPAQLAIFRFLKTKSGLRWASLILLALVGILINSLLARDGIMPDTRRLLQGISYGLILLITFVVAGGIGGLKNAIQRFREALPKNGDYSEQMREAFGLLVPFLWIAVKVLLIGAWYLLPEQLYIDSVMQSLDGVITIIDGVFATLLFTIARPAALLEMRDLRQMLIEGSSDILKGKGEELVNRDALGYEEGNLNKFIDVSRAFHIDLVALPDRSVDPLPEENKMITLPFSELVNKGRNGWLIVGEAGSGKTTALISILADMLKPFASAHKPYPDDGVSPIPVKVELSDWSQSRRPFLEWLESEIAATYRISRVNARVVLEGDGNRNDFFLLLDGLDEMSATEMRVCIREINELLANRNGVSIVSPRLVVCCRTVPYREAIERGEFDPEAPRSRVIERKLHLDGAVELLDLNPEQIRQYVAVHFSTAEHPLTAAEITLAPAYESVFKSPLVLAIALKVNKTLETLQTAPESDPTALEEKIYGDFIKQSLVNYALHEKRPNDEDYQQYVRGHLAWLAKKMPKGIFTIEDMQPSWLKLKPTSSFFQPTFLFWLLVYLVGSRVTVATIIAFGAGLSTASPFENITAGVMAGLFVSLFDLLRFYFRRREGMDNIAVQSWQEPLVKLFRPILMRLVIALKPIVEKVRDGEDNEKPKRVLIYDDMYWNKVFIAVRRGAIGFAVVFAGTTIIIALHFIAIGAHRTEPGFGVFGSTLAGAGLVRAMFIALFMAFFMGVGRTHHALHSDITLIENVQAQFGGAIFSGLQWGIVAAFIVGVIASILYNSSPSSQDTIRTWLQYSTQEVFNVPNSPSGFFIVGAFFGALGGFITGVLGGILRLQDKSQRETFDPNRGIEYSLLNAVRNLIVLGGFFALLLGGGLLLATGDLRAAGRLALSGFSVGVFALPQYGALALVNHITLKLIMYVRGQPLRYLGHLDGFAKLRLIVRKGRGYTFFHDKVLDYFREEKKVFVEKLRFERLIRTAGLIGVGALVFISLPELHARLMNIDIPADALIVEGPVIRTDQVYTAGQMVEIRSKGMLRTGAYVGYVPPEGTETGIFGAPIGDIYDIGSEPLVDGIPPFANGNALIVPHGALLCRVEGELQWRQCAYLQTFGIPYSWRTFTLEMPYSGVIEFRVNDYLLNDSAGSFAVVIENVAPGIVQKGEGQ